MSPEYVAALAESVGALAVVVSLLYLARQVRQSGQHARLATIQAVNNQFHAVTQLTATSPDHARIWTTGLLQGMASLEDDEAKLFTQLVGLSTSSYVDLFFYREEGLIDEARFRILERPYVGQLACPGFRDFWKMFGPIMPEKYREYIDKKIVEVQSEIDLSGFNRLKSEGRRAPPLPDQEVRDEG